MWPGVLLCPRVVSRRDFCGQRHGLTAVAEDGGSSVELHGLIYQGREQCGVIQNNTGLSPIEASASKRSILNRIVVLAQEDRFSSQDRSSE